MYPICYSAWGNMIDTARNLRKRYSTSGSCRRQRQLRRYVVVVVFVIVVGGQIDRHSRRVASVR